MTPQVSVVIACRNAAATLGIQLEALTRQDCPVPWDVVISDNGSTDGSVALARSYRSRLPGLTIIDSSGRPGAGYARNVGASATQAPLLVFCDADDEVAPGWLTAMVNALQRDDFVAGRFESRKLNDTSVLRSRELQQSTGLQESPFGPDLPHAGAGNLGVSRALFFSVGGFDPAVGCLEDTDLCWRIQLTGARLVFCAEAIVHVRLRSSLSTMWAQGVAYGAAAALLEHRFPQPPPTLTAVGPTSSGPSGKVHTVVNLLSEHRSAGALLWTLGWHVGHRKWQPASGPVIPVSPAAAPARRAS
jgi:cellulose synthase/poly-beta-1,6-N-acetylglucosamine synthase-like glycosyltransferase